MTREEFRAWVRLQPRGRFERIDGEVVAMAPERMAHLRVKRNVLLALVRGIGSAKLACEALPDGATAEVENGECEPDAVVQCGDPVDSNATVAGAPSPASRR